MNKTELTDKIITAVVGRGKTIQTSVYEEVEKLLASHRLSVLEEVEGIINRNVVVHKQLDEEFIGSIVNIKLGRKSESPHRFVVENNLRLLSQIKEIINEMKLK